MQRQPGLSHRDSPGRDREVDSNSKSPVVTVVFVTDHSDWPQERHGHGHVVTGTVAARRLQPECSRNLPVSAAAST